MREYNAPKCFWCYAAEYAVEIINHTAARRIKWRTPYEILHGDTPDISVFRFSFFEPIYYLNPHASYPQLNMLPGRFLGIARTTGDHFTFIIFQDMQEILNLENHSDDGKLYAKVKWNNQQETLIPADLIRSDDPL
jgi:hypothetical protein